MLLSLMIAAQAAVAQPPISAIEAERAFAADAHKSGQWTAFRNYAAPDALMFVPQPVNAHAWMTGRKDPPVAVFWWPGRSYVSCDGNFAINTGPWVREWGKSVGYFTTVWVRQPSGGWKWTYDAGDAEDFARGEGGDIKPVVAKCGSVPKPGVPTTTIPTGAKTGSGQSRDGTVRYLWHVTPTGAREFRAWLWDGKIMQPVITDKVVASGQ